MNAYPHIFILAGESSGDRLGAALMRRLREETGGQCRITGVGGEAMIAEGLEPIFPMQDIAVMGFVEVLPHIKRIRQRLKQAADEIARSKPDALVTIDAQVFSGMLAKRVKRSSPETALVHYVAPTVWAWKPWRARKVARYLDRLLALFPFEPPYFEREGLTCDFVGHPVVERASAVPKNSGNALRDELGIARDAQVLLVAPGSRTSEITRLMEPFGDAVARLAVIRPEIEVILPVAAPVAEQVRGAGGGWPSRVHVLDPTELAFEDAERRKFAAFAAADIALAASGTVTLELAAMRVPMIVGYRMPKLTECIARRMINLDTGTLVNIITDQKIVPEYWQDDCNGEALANALANLFENGGQTQIAGFNRAFEMLGEDDASPSLRAARSVLAALADNKRQRLATTT